jgi:hypothetical protein
VEAVGVANRIFRNPEYGSPDLAGFFSSFLATHPLTWDLQRYLEHPSLYWFDDEVHRKLQESLASVLAARIDSVFRTLLPDRLGTAFETDPRLRDTLWYSMFLLARIGYQGQELSSESRVQAYALLRQLVRSYPGVLHKTQTIDNAEQPWLALFRAQLYTVMGDLRAVDRTELAAATGFTGAHQEIAARHGILVLDNGGLDPGQLQVIRDLLDRVPSDLLDLDQISVFHSLGNPVGPDGKRFTRRLGASPGVNIAPVPLDILANQFPSDRPPVPVPTFASILHHELNHSVDRVAVRSDPTRQDRKLDLIARAWGTSLQYLRSMFGPDFFMTHPQEFFASIANEYFSDSLATLQLGLGRFESGWLEPINQFLFFAEVYSRGGSSTLFYELDADGSYRVERAPVGRDEHGHIDRISWHGIDYEFRRDAEGNVIDIPQGDPVVIEIPIRSGNDDLQERLSNGQVTSHKDLEVGDGFLDALRFEDVDVPRGATVQRASLQVVPVRWRESAPTITYRAHAADHSDAIGKSRRSLSRLPRTSQHAIEKAPAWTPGVYNVTTDFAPIVQEVVNRSGWSAGNALTILAETSSSRRRQHLIGSYDTKPDRAAILVIEYMP